MVTTEEGEITYFRHPIFQANIAFICELVVLNCLFWPFINMTKANNSNWFDFKTGYLEFLPPAFLDWADRILVNIGIS